MAPKTNKLNIYLIKDMYKSFEDILKSSKCRQIKLNDYATLYYNKSTIGTPEWLDTFFVNQIGEEYRANFKTSGVQALLLIKIESQKGERIFALPFGYGRFLLKDNVTEDRFGLRTTLNVLNEKGIRNIEKRTFSKNPKLSRE